MEELSLRPRNLVSRLIHGFLLGCAFTIAGAIVVYFAMGTIMGRMYDSAQNEMQEMQEMQAASMESYGYRQYSQDAKLRIENDHYRRIENGVEILLQVRNEGSGTWKSVSLEAELFDAEGNFVYECSEYARGHLEPGGSMNVLVKCGGCQNSSVPEFSNYEIRITDASSG